MIKMAPGAPFNEQQCPRCCYCFNFKLEEILIAMEHIYNREKSYSAKKDRNNRQKSWKKYGRP